MLILAFASCFFPNILIYFPKTYGAFLRGDGCGILRFSVCSSQFAGGGWQFFGLTFRVSSLRFRVGLYFTTGCGSVHKRDLVYLSQLPVGSAVVRS